MCDKDRRNRRKIHKQEAARTACSKKLSIPCMMFNLVRLVPRKDHMGKSLCLLFRITLRWKRIAVSGSSRSVHSAKAESPAGTTPPSLILKTVDRRSAEGAEPPEPFYMLVGGLVIGVDAGGQRREPQSGKSESG